MQIVSDIPSTKILKKKGAKCIVELKCRTVRGQFQTNAGLLMTKTSKATSSARSFIYELKPSHQTLRRIGI